MPTSDKKHRRELKRKVHRKEIRKAKLRMQKREREEKKQEQKVILGSRKGIAHSVKRNSETVSGTASSTGINRAAWGISNEAKANT